MTTTWNCQNCGRHLSIAGNNTAGAKALCSHCKKFCIVPKGPLQFTCRNRDCGAVNEIPREYAGQLAACYACGATNRVPGSIPRTSRWKIIGRWWTWPIIVLSFYAFFWSWISWDIVLVWMFGGIGALAIATFLLWAIMRIAAWFIVPKDVYRTMKEGGFDPFFDAMCAPFNCDPPEVRWQELYRAQEQIDLQRDQQRLDDFTRRT